MFFLSYIVMSIENRWKKEGKGQTKRCFEISEVSWTQQRVKSSPASNLYSNPTTRTRTRKKQSESSGQAQAAATGVLRHQTSVPFEGFESVSLPHHPPDQSTENIDTNTLSMF